jgi:hypothetical protein
MLAMFKRDAKTGAPGVTAAVKKNGRGAGA